MRQAGINVALGTDGAASNNDLDLFGEMRTAALLGKAVAKDATAIPDRYAIEMATINGARALGIDDLVGSLEVGKQADIIAIDMGGLEQQPLFHPSSQLVYTNPASRGRPAWVKGRQLLEDGLPTTLDLEAIITKTKLWRERITQTQ